MWKKGPDSCEREDEDGNVIAMAIKQSGGAALGASESWSVYNTLQANTEGTGFHLVAAGFPSSDAAINWVDNAIESPWAAEIAPGSRGE
jgi:hypothetical protein